MLRIVITVIILLFIYAKPPKMECGCPSGEGIKNGHMRYPSYGGMQKVRNNNICKAIILLFLRQQVDCARIVETGQHCVMGVAMALEVDTSDHSITGAVVAREIQSLAIGVDG